MGAAIVDHRTKTHAKRHFRAVFNNAQAQCARHELGFELQPHAPYSPDLAPYDFFLFPILKILLRGKRFSSL